jgi:hypothetical protein
MLVTSYRLLVQRIYEVEVELVRVSGIPAKRGEGTAWKSKEMKALLAYHSNLKNELQRHETQH